MKKSEFIKRVLRSRRNTVFTTKEQVEVALKIFESLGILPPNVKVTREIYGNNKGDIELLKDIVSYDYEICWEPEDE